MASASRPPHYLWLMPDPETSDNAPSYRNSKSNCPRCGALAHQTWSDLLIEDGDGFIGARDDKSARPGPFGPEGNYWSMSTCFACDEASVWRGHQLIYPPANPLPKPHTDMPDAARELYDEARAVAAISRRAGAALARAALEALLKELRPQSDGRLDERIAALQPEVSLGLWQILSVLRHTGNKALHGADEDGLVAIVMDDDGATLSLLLGAINDLTEELVSRPAQAANLFGMLPTGVAAEALRKAGLPPLGSGIEI